MCHRCLDHLSDQGFLRKWAREEYLDEIPVKTGKHLYLQWPQRCDWVEATSDGKKNLHKQTDGTVRNVNSLFKKKNRRNYI